jgi:hypothetical protein
MICKKIAVVCMLVAGVNVQGSALGNNVADMGIPTISKAQYMAAFDLRTNDRMDITSHRKPRKKKAKSRIEKIQRDTVVINRGYTPSIITVKGGVPLQLTFVSTGNSCANSLTIPSLNKTIALKSGQSRSITFTPKKNETIDYNCTMEMYRGQIVAE